jgi:CBS domain-containing protein
VNVPNEYAADFLYQIQVKDCATFKVYSLHTEDTVEQTRKWLLSGSDGSLHHGYPVLDKNEKLAGVISRKEIEDFNGPDNAFIKDLLTGPIVAINEDHSMREVADMMALYRVSRIPVVDKLDSYKVIGLVSRNDVLKARRNYLEQKKLYHKYINFSSLRGKKV